MKDITLLIAHCDDEAIFLWPFLDRVKRIVCATSDENNPARAWCKDRRECLRRVCDLIGAEMTCFRHNSEFYRLGTRDSGLKIAAKEIMESLRPAEIVATHNAWGEYGHIDHILCHYIARTLQAQTNCQVLVTDIAQEINWLPVRSWNQGLAHHMMPPLRPLGWTESSTKCQIDHEMFDRIKAIYDARGCWTWSWEPQVSCGVYGL